MNKYDCIFASVLVLCITILIILFSGEPDIRDKIINIDELIELRINKANVE